MRTHTHAHTQGKTCNVYILAIISEPNIRTSGVVGKSNIVLSEEVYIAKKKRHWAINKLKSELLQIRHFNKYLLHS